MKQSLVVVALSTVLFSTGVAADEMELLVPISGEEMSKVEAENAYFLKKHRYFAKQSKIVRINSEALKNAKNIHIELFGGVGLTAERHQFEEIAGREIVWTGMVTDPAFDRSRYDHGSKEKADCQYQTDFRIRLIGRSFDREIYSGAVFESGQDFMPKQGSLVDIRRNDFYTVLADIRLPTLPSQYKIRALEMSPEFHILIEVDRNLEYPAGEISRPSEAVLELLRRYSEVDENAIETTVIELKERQRKHEEFLRDLGPDPRRH